MPDSLLPYVVLVLDMYLLMMVLQSVLWGPLNGASCGYGNITDIWCITEDDEKEELYSDTE